MPSQQGWNLLAFGLLCSSIGTLGLFWFICHSGKKNEAKVLEKAEKILSQEENQSQVIQQDTQAIKELEELQGNYAITRENIERLENELALKTEELNNLQNHSHLIQRQLEELKDEFEAYKHTAEVELEEQKKALDESQKTISDQREGIDKKLQQIAQLESKVSDLTYEIKTLIQLAEIENQSMPIYPNLPATEHSNYLSNFDVIEDEASNLFEKQVVSEDQATIQLKRCIDIAQKITGANHYSSSNSRFKDLAIDNYTLDLRRLFDSLRMENASTIIFYSQKENKILFVNNQAKNLLGWSPEKFILSFNDIVEPSREIWKQGIASLAIKNTSQLDIKMKSKTGALIDVQALLGIIPTGIFRHYILGVLYQNKA